MASKEYNSAASELSSNTIQPSMDQKTEEVHNQNTWISAITENDERVAMKVLVLRAGKYVYEFYENVSYLRREYIFMDSNGDQISASVEMNPTGELTKYLKKGSQVVIADAAVGKTTAPNYEQNRIFYLRLDSNTTISFANEAIPLQALNFENIAIAKLLEKTSNYKTVVEILSIEGIDEFSSRTAAYAQRKLELTDTSGARIDTLLIEDMATNEGGLLNHLFSASPTVAISKITVTIREGRAVLVTNKDTTLFHKLRPSPKNTLHTPASSEGFKDYMTSNQRPTKH